MTRKLRVQVSPTRSNAAGQRAVGVGLRVGYWPCLRAPYLQIAFGVKRVDIWHGLPSYREDLEP